MGVYMSRRYRRRSRRSKKPKMLAIALGIMMAVVLLNKFGELTLCVAIIVTVCIIVIKIIRWYISKKDNTTLKSYDYIPQHTGMFQDASQNSSQKIYTAKDSIMTDCEMKFFNVIKKIIGTQYSIQPQINLASVIDKTSHEKYRNELFRNIDFGIFDESYRLVVLIEINDQSHTQYDRRVRDARVADICKEAGLPLITFWTYYGVNEQYIRGRLSEYLALKIDEAEKRTQVLIRKYRFDFSLISKEEIIRLLEEEIENKESGSAEYIRALCGYLYCLGDETDAALIEKAKYGVDMDVGSMIDAEWIESLKNGGNKSENIRSRDELVKDFVSYYKDFVC